MLLENAGRTIDVACRPTAEWEHTIPAAAAHLFPIGQFRQDSVTASIVRNGGNLTTNVATLKVRVTAHGIGWEDFLREARSVADWIQRRADSAAPTIADEWVAL